MVSLREFNCAIRMRRQTPQPCKFVLTSVAALSHKGRAIADGILGGVSARLVLRDDRFAVSSG